MTEQIIIIPNEDYISDGVWPRKLVGDERHGKIIYDYALEHNLGLTFESVGVEAENYNGHLWGIALAKLGHASIHCGEKMIIYVPDIITKEQYDFFKKYRSFIGRFRNDTSACILNFKDNVFEIKSISADIDNGVSLFPINLFYEKLRIKYNIFNKEKEKIMIKKN